MSNENETETMSVAKRPPKLVELDDTSFVTIAGMKTLTARGLRLALDGGDPDAPIILGEVVDGGGIVGEAVQVVFEATGRTILCSTNTFHKLIEKARQEPAPPSTGSKEVI